MTSKLCGISLESYNTTRAIQIGLMVLDYPDMYTPPSEPLTNLIHCAQDSEYIRFNVEFMLLATR